MPSDFNRRRFIQWSLVGAISLYFQKIMAATGDATSSLAPFVLSNVSSNPGNFHAVFNNPQLRQDFFLFLKNVYNIYPEKEFHLLVGKMVDAHKTDEEIYKAILVNLGSVKPLFSEVTYALPALAKQKKEIAAQTVELLKNKKSINGYLEIGTPGRYVNALKSKIEIKGDIALINVEEPSYSPIDIAERGQLAKVARYVPLNDYNPISVQEAADESFDLVTNYIGFHHSSLEKLENFVLSVRRVLRPGGTLILRDHDVTDEKMNHMVSLAHDVFNAGLKAQWKTNHQEVRNFRSLNQWRAYLKERGFQFNDQQIFQDGDPTKNALMDFTRV